MRVDDFIIFGRTVPEESKRYGQRVCMAGYSKEMKQFMRIYPLDIRSKTKARCMISAELERNNMDSRFESWALKSRSEDSILEISDPIHKEKIKPILEKHLASSIDELNEKRCSLGVIKPDHYEVFLKTRAHIKDPNQLQLFDTFQKSVSIRTANDYFLAPYVKINSAGKQSCLQIREWGVYELMRKYERDGRRITEEDIRKALTLNEKKDVFFIVGNMSSVRSVWLIIKTFSYDRERQIGMFQ